MSGYMDLFLETGNPAFYMMAKQESATARAAPGSAVNGVKNPTEKEGTSPQ